MKFKRNNALTILGTVFLGVGLIMSVAGSVILANHISFNNNNPSTNAVIEEIETSTRTVKGKSRTSHRVYVSYEAGESEYYTQLGYYSSGMHEGDLIKIYYDKNNPEKIKTGSYLAEMIVIPMGLLYAGIGTAMFVSDVKKKKKQRYLFENGIRADALITEVLTDRSTKVNGKHPVYLLCQITNEITGFTTTFKSESTFSDLSQYIGQTVTIYSDPAGTDDAFVDIQALVENRISGENYSRLEY